MRPNSVPLDQPSWTSTDFGPYECGMCSGTGLVLNPYPGTVIDHAWTPGRHIPDQEADQ